MSLKKDQREMRSKLSYAINNFKNINKTHLLEYLGIGLEGVITLKIITEKCEKQIDEIVTRCYLCPYVNTQGIYECDGKCEKCKKATKEYLLEVCRLK